MEKLYIGPTGSGKSTLLLEKFIETGKRTRQTDHLLAFVKNATSVTDWRHKVDLPSIGPLHIYTYFGFIQSEITDFWPWIEEKLLTQHSIPEEHDKVEAIKLDFGGQPQQSHHSHTEENSVLTEAPPASTQARTLEPTFMNVETSHFLMSRLVEEARIQDGAFSSITGTSQQIAVQLIDNLNHASMNGLSFDKVQHRLLNWAGSDKDKAQVYRESVRVMRRFRAHCLKTRCLDYSLIICLYNDHLLPDEAYFKDLTKRYRYLYVDDLEKTIPTAQDLILKLMQEVEETHLCFNPEGGFTAFFGGSPKLAEETFFPICDKVYLDHSYTTSEESRSFAKAVTEKVGAEKTMPKHSFLKRDIQTDLRGDMLLQVAEEVHKLIEKGVPPGQIALIAPIIDKVMDFTLHRYFTTKGYPIANLTRTKRLLDEPYAQALITLAFLVNPGWKLELNFSSLMQTLSLILKLDPVRSALLAEEIFKHRLTLPDLDEINLRPRLGFNNADKYDLFRDWVQQKQTEELELEHFFQVVFGELLAPLAPEEKDILACRQIIASITKFKRVMTRFTRLDDKKLGQDFIEMVLKGTLAAEVLFRPPSSNAQIIIATPYTFLFSPYVKQVQYLFWLDVASDNWFQSSTKELTNPHVLSRQWREEDSWTDELDQSLRKEQLLSYLTSLLNKCTDGLYMANSYYNSRGWEQEGELLEWLQPDFEVAL